MAPYPRGTECQTYRCEGLKFCTVRISYKCYLSLSYGKLRADIILSNTLQICYTKFWIYIYIYIYVLGTTIPFPQMSVFSALKLIWNLKQMWGSFKRHGIRTVANYGGGGRHVNKHKHTQWHVNLWSNLKLSSKLGKWRETFFSFRDNRSRILPQTAVMC